MEANRCPTCGCFMRYEDDSYQSEGGWNEDEGYICMNKKCGSKKEAEDDEEIVRNIIRKHIDNE